METGAFFIVFYLAVLIFSVMVHEISHGYMAERLGDPTARLAGRLTLNPLKHIDPFGSVLLPILLILVGSPLLLGWAKPVPYNPNNLYKDYKYGPLKVALAGPAANIALLIFFGLVARFGFGILSPILVGIFGFVAFLNTFLAVFNLVPIPPLDGSKILTLFLPPRYAYMFERFGIGMMFFVFIAIYFLLGVVAKIAGTLFALVAGIDAMQATMVILFSV